MEWAGGRNGAINGPTVDFRSFFSGRGVTTNFVVAVRPAESDRLVRAAVRPGRRWPPRPAGPERPPPSARPRRLRMARARRLAGTDKYGLDAYIYDSTDDQPDQLRPGAVRAQQERRRRRWPTCARAGWPTSRSAIVGGALDGKTGGHAGQGRGAERRRLAGAAVPHLGEPGQRDLGGMAGRAGFTGDFAEYVAQKFPTSTAGDFAVIEAGVVSEETYVQQAPVLGEGAPAAAPVPDQDLPAGSRAGRVPGAPTRSSTKDTHLGRIGEVAGSELPTKLPTKRRPAGHPAGRFVLRKWRRRPDSNR